MNSKFYAICTSNSFIIEEGDTEEEVKKLVDSSVSESNVVVSDWYNYGSGSVKKYKSTSNNNKPFIVMIHELPSDVFKFINPPPKVIKATKLGENCATCWQSEIADDDAIICDRKYATWGDCLGGMNGTHLKLGDAVCDEWREAVYL